MNIQRFAVCFSVLALIAVFFVGVIIHAREYKLAAAKPDVFTKMIIAGDECAIQGFAEYRLLKNGGLVCYDSFGAFTHTTAIDRIMP